jgi:hypothetical protein
MAAAGARDEAGELLALIARYKRGATSDDLKKELGSAYPKAVAAMQTLLDSVRLLPSARNTAAKDGLARTLVHHRPAAFLCCRGCSFSL